MTTRAFIQGEDTCRNLQAECRALIDRAREEASNQYLPLRAPGISAIVFAVVALICGFWFTPVIENSVMSSTNLIKTICWAMGGGCLTWALVMINASDCEVSDEIYRQLTVLRQSYVDLDGLRHGETPLSITTLLRHLHDLYEALDSDIKHPHRKAFQYNKDEKIKFFEFNHCLDEDPAS